MNWIDVSTPLNDAIPAWPGDTPFALSPSARIANGDICNVSSITLSTHCGTHVDAPWHFEDDGRRLDAVNSDVFFGQARVVSVLDKRLVDADDLGPNPLSPRILLRTDNSARSLNMPFTEGYAALTENAAQRLVDESVQLIGVDYLSVAPFEDPAPVHHILLRAGVFIVEGLRLAAIPDGTHEFIVLPLAIVGADGAPARAFIHVQA